MLRSLSKLASTAVGPQRTVLMHFQRQKSSAVSRDARTLGSMLRQDPLLSALSLGFAGLFGVCNYSVSVSIIR